MKRTDLEKSSKILILNLKIPHLPYFEHIKNLPQKLKTVTSFMSTWHQVQFKKFHELPILIAITISFKKSVIFIWDKLFKGGLSKFCGRQPA